VMEFDIAYAGLCGVLAGEGDHFLPVLTRGGEGEGEGRKTSVMSMPTTFPLGPIFCAARKTSNPLPQPRSTTVSPCPLG